MNPIEIKVSVTLEAPALVAVLNKFIEGVKPAFVSEVPMQERTVLPETKLTETQKKVDAALDKLYSCQESSEPETVLESVDAAGTEAAPADTQREYTVEEVRMAIAEVSKQKGREAARGILDALGVKSVSNLKPEQYAEAMKLTGEV